MGPKKKPDDEDSSLMDMMRSMSAQLTSLNTKMENMELKMGKIDVIDAEVKGLKVLLNDLKAENKILKEGSRETDRKLNQMNDRNNALENRINSLEQHHRGWSARVLNIPLSSEEESDNSIVIEKVYNLVLLPILRGAVERKMLPNIPTAEQILEIAHVLPSKPGTVKPVIMRFYNRNVKDIIFKLKKFYAPREEPRGGGARGANGGQGAGRSGADVPGGGAERSGAERSGAEELGGGFEGRGKYSFPLYEDLIKAAFLKMRTIANDNRVKACWSSKGQIRFILHKNLNEVKKVVSLLDPLDLILG